MAKAKPEENPQAPEPVVEPQIKSIWKPKGQEFGFDTDFKAIADELGQPIESVQFELTDEAVNGQDGHVLSGRVAI